tara:strand:- start:62863 stop:63204 length:342 start_codon:yes stop_codon:yes gene_type:complete
VEDYLMDKEQQTTINLNAHADGQLNESFLKMFGSFVKTAMRYVFGDDVAIPVNVKGTKRQIGDFAKVLGKEKRYLQAYQKYGLDNPMTHRNRASLNSAIKNFERSTKIKWPFK